MERKFGCTRELIVIHLNYVLIVVHQKARGGNEKMFGKTRTVSKKECSHSSVEIESTGIEKAIMTCNNCGATQEGVIIWREEWSEEP